MLTPIGRMADAIATAVLLLVLPEQLSAAQLLAVRLPIPIAEEATDIAIAVIAIGTITNIAIIDTARQCTNRQDAVVRRQGVTMGIGMKNGAMIVIAHTAPTTTPINHITAGAVLAVHLTVKR